jgi:glucokinase
MKRRAIALDAGGTKLAFGLVGEDGEVTARGVRTWPPGGERVEVLECVREAIAALRADAADVHAIGAGIPANLDLATGVAVSSRHLPLAGFAFRDWLAETAGLPAFVDNDTTLALWAEHRLGAARGAREAVMLTIGTGIGGGILSGGRLVHGARGAAGEPGHMTIDADGPPCPGDCPGRGCLEAYVSGPALAKLGREYAAKGPDYNLGRMLAEKGELTGADVVHAARAGDPGAHEALALMGAKLGAGIASLLNLLDPEVVVIGGGTGVGARELLLEPAEREARARALEPAASATRIELALLGDDAGVVGAGLFALAGGDA